MMRPIYILFMAVAMLFLPGSSFAEDYSDCRLTCNAEKETRNMNCPSPYDVSDQGQQRRQCMKDNQSAYDDCVSRCPTPPRPASSDEQPAPAPMAY